MNTDPQPEDSSNDNPEPETSQPEAAPPAAPEPTASTPPPVAEPASNDSGLSKDSLNMGMLCHLLAFCGIIAPFVGNVLGPLVIWLIKKDEDAYVDQQGKESVNFQISVTIYSLVCLGMIMTIILAPIAGILLTIVGLGALVLTIIGAIKASKGEAWQYPLTIRLIK